MKVDITPVTVEATEGQPVSFTVTIYNTRDVIGAYSVRVLGIDPAWVVIDNQAMSLFPETTGTATATVTLPKDFPAGRRQLAIQVTSLVDATEFALTQIELDVPEVKQLALRVEPTLVYGRKRTTFGLIINNRGNTVLDVAPTVVDAEEVTNTEFDEPVLRLVPGEQQIIEANVTGKQPWLGQPAPRSLEFSVEGVEDPPIQTAAFLQRPKIGRWVLALAGLMAAMTVFAVVLSRTFQDVVDENAIDEALLEQALDNEDDPEGGGAAALAAEPGSASGTVVVAGSEVGIPGVTVELYDAGNALVPVRTAATAEDGSFLLADLSEGTFKLRTIGAGFGEVWYTDAESFEFAEEFDVALGEVTDGLDVALGGQPGSVSGVVVAEDVTDTTATLVLQAAALETDLDAELASVKVSADGTFLFEEVPAPARYELIVEKPGFTAARRIVDVDAGQDVEGIELLLSSGDGSVSGTISSPSGLLGGATIVATDGIGLFTTVSLTTPPDEGFFALRELPTPGTYTLTVSRDGYDSETLTVVLAEAANEEDLAIVLQPNQGRISGLVRVDPPGAGTTPVARGGVLVSASDGTDVFTTLTASANDGSGDEVGSYQLDLLPVPATYTVTFSAPGLVSQTRAAALTRADPAAGTALNLTETINVTLSTATAVIRGTVTEGAGGAPIGGVDISVTDGTLVLETTSADSVSGTPPVNYEILSVPPGTYTVTFARPGSSAVTRIVTLRSGELVTENAAMGPQAGISGIVTRRLSSAEPVPGPAAGAAVRLFLLEDFPFGEPVLTTVSEADGSYSFSSIATPQAYVIEFADFPGGAGRGSITRVLSPGQQVTDADFTIDDSGA